MATKLTPETAQRLRDASIRINQASDLLNVQFHKINQALKELNIGIGYDYKIPSASPIPLTLSYARYDDKGWQLIVSNDTEQWALTHAPRHMRIKVVGHLPTFLEGLVEAVIKSTEEVESAARLAELMVSGIPKDLRK